MHLRVAVVTEHSTRPDGDDKHTHTPSLPLLPTSTSAPLPQFHAAPSHCRKSHSANNNKKQQTTNNKQHLAQRQNASIGRQGTVSHTEQQLRRHGEPVLRARSPLLLPFALAGLGSRPRSAPLPCAPVTRTPHNRHANKQQVGRQTTATRCAVGCRHQTLTHLRCPTLVGTASKVSYRLCHCRFVSR